MPKCCAARRMSAIRRVFFAVACALSCGPAHAQSKADASRGAAKAGACVACHGSPEAAPPPGMPALGGQQAEFMVLQLILIREGLRDVPQMAGLLKGFSDGDLADVSAYFAREAPPPASSKADPKLRARGADLAKDMGCRSCHMGNYEGQRQVPRITGQREDYLAATLKAYRDNTRTGIDTSMNNAMYKVTDEEIRALAHYLAHLGSGPN
jgi:cytochrome c553